MFIYRMLKPTISPFPEARHALKMRSQPSMVMAKGFSQKTCFPASKAATACSSWTKSGEQTATASISSRSSSRR